MENGPFIERKMIIFPDLPLLVMIAERICQRQKYLETLLDRCFGSIKLSHFYLEHPNERINIYIIYILYYIDIYISVFINLYCKL